MRVVHVCRKPLSEKTVAKNVLEHGTGALNIDGCRIHGGPSSGGQISGSSALGQSSGWNAHENRTTKIDRSMSKGRWPTNLILQHKPGCKQGCEPGCPVSALDEQSGIQTNTSHYSYKRSGGAFVGGIPSQPEKDRWVTETGGASRYYKQTGGNKP